MKIISMLKIVYIRNGLEMIKLGYSKEIIDSYINEYKNIILGGLEYIKNNYGLEKDNKMRFLLNNKHGTTHNN